MNEKTELTRAWLVKAQRDLEGARDLSSGHTVLLDLAAYHCQQAAEKSVKAFLLYHDQRVERSHDVGMLLRVGAGLEPRLASLAPAGARLTPFASEYRYPGPDLEPTREQFDEAMAAAEQIYGLVLSLLPREVHP